MAKIQDGGHRPGVPLSKTVHRVEPHSEPELKQPFGKKERETAEKRAHAKQTNIPFKNKG
jgi:hypothetical protein